MSRFYTPFL